MKPLASSKTLKHQRKKILELLPQTCRIYGAVREFDATGAIDEKLGSPLEYDGLPDIPCRLDASRYPRYGVAFGQELVVSEFELHIPYDAPIYADHKIQIDNQWFEIRKLADIEPHRVTKYALVDRLDIGDNQLT